MPRFAQPPPPERRGLFDGSTIGLGSGRASGAGMDVSPGTALGIAAVWQAVNLYANTIASLDCYVAEGDPRGGHEAAFDHWAYDLVHSRPNTIQTSFRFRQTLIAHSLTWGAGFAEIEWDARGRRAVALHLLDPRDVAPTVREDGRLTYRLQRSRYGSNYEVPGEDVIAVGGLGFDGVNSYSPITVARESLGLAKAQQTYQSALFQNGAVPTGYLQTDADTNEVENSQLRAAFNEMHQGAGKAGNVGILSGGLRWVQTSFSPADAELLTSRNFSVSEVARIFNMPPHLLGQMDGSTFSNIEEQNIHWYQNSLLPWLTCIEQEFNAKLFGPIERGRFFIRHNINSLLRGNLAARSAYHTAMFGIGAMSPNEVRAADGLNPIDDPQADKHFIPVNNLTALEDLGKTPPEPVAESAPDDTTENPVEVKPAEEAAPSKPVPGSLEQEAAQDAVRAVVADSLGRCVRREAQAVRKAARRSADLDAWPDEFYPGHTALLVESLATPLKALAIITGRDYDPRELAETLVAQSREDLRGIVVTTPPEDYPASVDRLCERWEADKAREEIAKL